MKLNMEAPAKLRQQNNRSNRTGRRRTRLVAMRELKLKLKLILFMDGK